jgi:hypothetical protein
VPVYAFSCEQAHEFEGFLQSYRDENPRCVRCFAPTERIWKLGTGHSGVMAFPMTTSHLSGKPETFTSQSQLDARCRELGVTQRDDAAFVTKMYEGYDWRTGKQRYKESSGVGMPGCWV